MKIQIFDRQKALKISKPAIKKIIREALRFEKETCDEVTVHLISNVEMCNLHAEYFNDPSPTDCISFPLDGPEEDYRILGEIFVCPEIAIEFTKKKGGNPYLETTLYIIHGLLHLMGYDDISKNDRIEMRAAEKKHLDHLARMELLVNTPLTL